MLSRLRKENSLPSTYEFKFHDLTSVLLREKVFTVLAEASFQSWAIIVDKTTLPDPYKLLSGLDFYLFFVTELIKLLPEDKCEGAVLILDEFGSPARLPKELRRVMKMRSIYPPFKKIVAKRSRSEPLIQVADLVAGAALHRDDRQSSDPYQWIEKQIKKIVEFKA